MKLQIQLIFLTLLDACFYPTEGRPPSSDKLRIAKLVENSLNGSVICKEICDEIEDSWKIGFDILDYFFDYYSYDESDCLFQCELMISIFDVTSTSTSSTGTSTTPTSTASTSATSPSTTSTEPPKRK